MTTSTRRIDLMAVHQIEEALTTTDIAVVPVGAIEPHGRHAPMGSDTFIALEIAERLAEACGELVFPPVPFGNINLGYDFRYMPGTISLNSKLLIDLHRNIGHGTGPVGISPRCVRQRTRSEHVNPQHRRLRDQGPGQHRGWHS